jgi:phosphate starvation-inducible PhoH-like protein
MVEDNTSADQFDQEEGGSQKATRRQKRKAEKTVRQAKRNPKPIEARNKNQALYIKSLNTNELTFGVGPAGVGKTYVPSRIYGGMLARGDIEKLYVARPNVAKSKHKNGYLPGTLEEKTAPWLIPIFEGLKDAMSPADFDRFRRAKVIEEVPYEFMQGRTFKNAACIVDEAENLDLDDLYITLTRQGEGLSMVLCGDIRQARIHNSGLSAVVEMSKMPWMESVGLVEFGEEDVVRSRQARQWVMAFNRFSLSDGKNCVMDGDSEFKNDPPSFLRDKES